MPWALFKDDTQLSKTDDDRDEIGFFAQVSGYMWWDGKEHFREGVEIREVEEGDARDNSRKS